MQAVEVDIKDLLVEEGIGTFAAAEGWSLNVGFEPTNPDTTITLVASPSLRTNYVDAGAIPLREDTFKVLVRAHDQREAYQKAFDIEKFLGGKLNFDLNGSKYGAIVVDDNIFLFGQDENNRFNYTQSFTAWRKEIV